jgi:hypothetical protein
MNFDEFKKIMEIEKQKIMLDDDNLIYKLYNYILKELAYDYKIAFLFYNLAIDTSIIDANQIFTLSLLVNVFYLYIEIINNLNYFTNNKMTNNKLSVHMVFNENIIILGLLFTINHLMKINIRTFNQIETKYKNIYYKDIDTNINNIILPLTKINNQDINSFLDDKQNKIEILNNQHIIHKKDFLFVIIKYANVFNNKVTIIDEQITYYKEYLYTEINKQNTNFKDIRNLFIK